jgi:hypothetical protein
VDVNLEGPLSQACTCGNVEVVRILLADPRVNIDQGGPLLIACTRGNLGLIRVLLDCGRWLGIEDKMISTCMGKGLAGPAKELIARRKQQDAASMFCLIILHCDGFLELRK